MIGYLLYQKNVFSAGGSLYSALNLYGANGASTGISGPEIELLDNDSSFLLDNDGTQLIDNV